MRLSAAQRLFLASGSAALALLNPHRGDLVGVLGETTGTFALSRMRDRLLESESGRRLLATRPRVSTRTLDLARLRALPAHTFGARYVAFMDGHGYSPDERSPVRFVEDAELAWVMARYRETHDFVHVLTGLPPTVLGEIAQKWFEWLQTGLPMCALSALAGPLRLSPGEAVDLARLYVPWAFRCNASSKFLLAEPFEEHLDRDLSELRKALGVVPFSP